MNALADPSWWSSVLDAAPRTLLVTDANGTVLFANECAVRMFGGQRSELVGTPFARLLTAESAPEFRGCLEELLGARAPGTETRESPSPRVVGGIRKNGERFSIELSMAKAVSGPAAVAVIGLLDLAAEKRRQSSLSASVVEAQELGDRLEAMLEFAPAFIIGISPAATINFINRTLPQYSKKDVIGSSWLQYFPPERHALMEEKLAAAYATETTQVYEVNTEGPDGRPVWFETRIAPIRERGKIAGAVLVSQDVTEKKLAQAELLAGRHMNLLGTLAAGVAHEINTPIQFVGDSIQFLRDAGRDLLNLIEKLQALRRAAAEGAPLAEIIAAAAAAEEEADLAYVREAMPAALDRCVDGLTRVSTIVRSLKDFAHPAEKEMAPADLNRAVQTALTIARNEYKYVAELKLDLGDLPPVTCNVNDVSQAVLNVVVNAAHAIGDAVKGTDRTGLITVRTFVAGAEVVIAISDTGNGVPENIRSRIFDPFFTTKEVGKGTGQGLAIARSTIKDGHGGDVTFESELGKGTTFSIQLPIAGKPKG